MKNLITIVLFMFAFVASAQDLTLLHINAEWNQSNDFDLRGINHAKIIMARLEDQKPSLKASIKSVPTVVLLDKNGRPQGQWAAGLNFKLNIEKEVIQNRINYLLFGETTSRRRSTN
jgi:hypothetical protein